MREREREWLYNTVQEGDGLELLKSLGGETAQLVIFDPQYRPVEETNRTTETFYKQPNQEQSEMNITAFFKEINRILKPSAFCLLWIDDNILIKGNYKQWIPNNLKVKELLIWMKKGFIALGWEYFRQGCEYALLIQKEPHQRFVSQAKGSRGIRNIFSEFVNSTNRHNTHQKPYKMTKKIIKQLTNPGDLIVDPCAGSFVVLLACQKLKRQFIGTDLTLTEIMKFNINKENSRLLLKKG
ncbi:MAG: adenine-specific DNA methylase [Mycoplasmataceae bacterium RV_VA103A]|nr:MAG: adenine-specific DNA methylase [Mycoplasmataceae bacterium RV_VA103A]